MTTIETYASKSGYYSGMPCFYGRYRIIGWRPGFDVGWTWVTNLDGKRIAYEDAKSAKAGARWSAEQFMRSGQDGAEHQR